MITPKLSDILFHSAKAVRQVLAGQSLTEALEDAPKEQKAAVQSISFYCMRHLATAQVLSQQLLSKKAPNPLVHALLLVGLCLLTVSRRPIPEGELGKSIPQYNNFTIVDETIKASQLHKKTAAFKGLLNACLRRYLREQDVLWHVVQASEEAMFNYPQWWIDLIRKSYPNQWQDLLKVADFPGPLTLRVNRRKTSREAFSARLNEENLTHQCYGEDAIILDKAVPVQQIPGFDEGMCAVQDAGAQLAASLLPLRDGMRVLDACAAPGGKTAHLLERADIHMTAIDIEAKRLSRVEENLNKLGLYHRNVRLLEADASSLSPWWDGELFDIVMADVPCTASGVVRRHPDIKWLRQEADIVKTAALQRMIVKNLWSVLKPGGYFLYITCSIFPQEGVEQVEFMKNTFKDALVLDSPGQILPEMSQQQDRPLHDGFFYTLFQKVVC